jgi:hypothetical protein
VVLNIKDLVVPVEATWSTQVDNKRVWGTITKKQPGGNRQQRTYHLMPPEVAVKWATWKTLLNNLYLEGATHNLKGEHDAYTYTSPNALGCIKVLARFFDPMTQSFAPNPCFMAIALPSTGINASALTLPSDEVWGDDTLLHLLGLPVNDMGEYPFNPVCGTVGTECHSGLHPTPIRCTVLKTPLVWCMNWIFSRWAQLHTRH